MLEDKQPVSRELNEFNTIWTEGKNSTVMEAVKIENMSDVLSGKEHGVSEREGGGGTSEDKQGGEEWKKKVYFEAPGEEHVHVIRTESHAEGEGNTGAEGGVVEWGLEAEHCTERVRGWGGWIIGTESWSVWEALCLMCASQQNEWWEDYSSTFFFTGGILAGFYSL